MKKLFHYLCLIVPILVIGILLLCTASKDIQDTTGSSRPTVELMLDKTDETVIPTISNSPKEEITETIQETVPPTEYVPQKEETTEIVQETKPPHNHNYIETTVASSCTQNGYTLYKCNCGDSYKDNIKDKSNHKYIDKVIAPTTEAQGYTLHTCPVCGDSYKDNYTARLEKDEKPPVDNPSSGNQQTGDGTGSGNPNNDKWEYGSYDHGYCTKCGCKRWVKWIPDGCFTYLSDTVCECGVLVKAGECHHH